MKREGTVVAVPTFMYSLARHLACFVLVVPVLLAACSQEDGAPEDVAATEGAISGSITAGASLVTTTRVNLREGPSTSDDVIVTMPSGAVVKALSGAPSNGFYKVAYQGDEGWAYGAYLKAAGAAGTTDQSGSEASGPTASGGTFNGRSFSGVTVLWQGNWDFLLRCDSYSRSEGKVVFFCDESPSRSFVDNGAWIAVPRANFSRSMCGDQARVCKGSKCIVAKVVEKSETQGQWEGSTAVLKALGVSVGFNGCSSSFGTATGATITFQ